MNSAILSAITHCDKNGILPLVCFNGFEGLISGSLQPIEYESARFNFSESGSYIGTNRHVPSTVEELNSISIHLKKFSISGLIVIGGFEGFLGVCFLSDNRLPVSICYIPATISNNIPGTEYSIGSDTALNTIMNACDTIKKSANSSKNRVFIVEVQGGNSGYLAMMAGLASGASITYLPENTINLPTIIKDIKKLKEGFVKDTRFGRLVILNEKALPYPVHFLSNVFENESDGIFDCRYVVLGHLQQGSSSSPIDRIRSTTFLVLGLDHMIKTNFIPESFAVTLSEAQFIIKPIESLKNLANYSKRISNVHPWTLLLPYNNMITR